MLKLPRDVQPPKVKKEKVVFSLFEDIRVDNYYWMRLSDEQKKAEIPDSQTLAVVNHLKAENTYTKEAMRPLQSFQKQLYNEMVGRIKQTDMSVPFLKNGYFYLTRFEKGNEYPIYERKKDNLDNPAELLIDVNQLAGSYDYYQVNSLSVSPDNKILAYGEDTVSRRQYDIRFKNLETGEYLADVIKNTTGSAVWANDNKTVFYTRRDETLRPAKIYRHIIGSSVKEDQLVYHEKDETFYSIVYKSKSGKFIIIASQATVSSEFQILSADQPNGKFQVFQKRQKNHEYSIAHHEEKWYIKTNLEGAKNFKLMVTDLDQTESSCWQEFIPHQDNILLEGVEAFRDYLVVSIRKDGITQINIRGYAQKDTGYLIPFGEESYSVFTSNNPEYTNPLLRLTYTSMTTPITSYDYDTKNNELILKKQQEVVGDFDPSNYHADRIFARARDGEKIPISLVYRKREDKEGPAPLLLYAYGSYGHSMDPYFSSVRLSLLDRGFTYAIAHIRGGEEMGRKWYENGRQLKKKNTFYDFIDCGLYLIAERYADPKNLFAMGGSAGGLLMGAIMNMAPTLWKGVIAAVPFVDVLTTMLDTSIPLTTGEYDEWGNPNNEIFYHYIRSYSPIDNIENQDYPATLVTTGYFDSQVQYWEPAKWVAKLREYKTDNNLLLLHTNMEAGHGGKSGRFQKYKEIALEYAFILGLADKID